MANSSIKVLVCGVNFGKFYVDVCANSRDLQLVGILSRGSEKSVSIASEYGVPIYTDFEDVPLDAVDVVVFATRSLITGGKSSALVKKVLSSGIPVMQEQPVHFNEVVNISKSIVKESQSYYVNDFYRYLLAVDRFIGHFRELKEKSTILRINLSCSSQVLYPLVDVLYDMFGQIDDFKVEKVLDGNMNVLSGSIDSVPFVLHYYNEYSEDVDGSLALFFDIKVDTNLGNLTLNDPEGSVVWQSHLAYSKDFELSSEVFKGLKPLETLYDSGIDSYYQRYTESWTKAMELSIKEFYKRCLDGSSAKRLLNKTLRQCEVCMNITNVAGVPKKVDVPYKTYFKD